LIGLNKIPEQPLAGAKRLPFWSFPVST